MELTNNPMDNLLNMNWGGDGYPAYIGKLEGTNVGAAPIMPAAPVTTPAAPTTPSTPAAAPATPVASPTADPAAPPAAIPGVPVASPTTPAANPNDPNIAVLRQSHEQLTAMRALGIDLSTATTYAQTMHKLHTEAARLSSELNYTPESLAEAWKTDPAATIEFLRKEATTHRATPEAQREREIREQVDRATAPIRDHFQRQQADAANRTIQSEFDSFLSDHAMFKGKTLDPATRQMINDRYIETVKYNNAVLREVMQGKTSGLKKIADEVINDTIKAMTGFSTIIGGTPGNPAPNGAPRDPATGQFKGSLDDIINDTPAAQVLPSMRGFKAS